ncbi:MAG: GNAT family N-acetyltransferase [Clostridiaceae bacterium]|nr:GNAT family N-acetyltransferase [Clostridiaceae bacterium]
MEMEWKRISTSDRTLVDEFIRQQWYTTTMIIRGKEIDMTQTEGFYVKEQEDIIGLITYFVSDDVLEVISLNSLRENQGIGTKLVDAVIREAKDRKLKKILVVTTNDNINAIKFYQKRGFDMACLYHNALDISRKIKPEIPLIGDHSIPLRHEIEFELLI